MGESNSNADLMFPSAGVRQRKQAFLDKHDVHLHTDRYAYMIHTTEDHEENGDTECSAGSRLQQERKGRRACSTTAAYIDLPVGKGGGR